MDELRGSAPTPAAAPSPAAMSDIGSLLRTRQLTLGEFLSGAWQIFSERFATIAAVTLSVAIPVHAVMMLAGGQQANRILSAMLIAAAGAAGLLSTLAVILIADRAVAGELLSWGDAFAGAIERWTSALLVSVIGIVIVVPLMLLIIPGIIWASYYVFALQAAALRDKTGKEALDRSKRLVRGSWGWGRVFLLLLLLGLMGQAITYGVAWVPGILVGPVIGGAIREVLGSVVGSFSTVLFTLIFLNCDARDLPAS